MYGAPYISRRTAARTVNVGKTSMVDVEMLFHASGEQTGHQLSLTEITWGAGQHSRLHVHHRESEAFYLLEGSMTLTVPGLTSLDVEPGEFVWSPAGLPHKYAITGSKPARVLVLGVPGISLTHFFSDLADGRAEVLNTPEQLAAYDGWSMADYGIEFMDEAAAEARTAEVLRHNGPGPVGAQ